MKGIGRILRGWCITPIFGSAVALGLTGCASIEETDASADEQALDEIDRSQSCFSQREIRGYSRAPDGPAGRERIYLDTGLNERFVLETTGACPALDVSLRLRLDTRTFGNVCTDDLATLIIPSTFAQDIGQCPVRVLGRVPAD